MRVQKNFGGKGNGNKPGKSGPGKSGHSKSGFYCSDNLNHFDPELFCRRKEETHVTTAIKHCC